MTWKELLEKFVRYSKIDKMAGHKQYSKGILFSVNSYDYRVISHFSDPNPNITTNCNGHILKRDDRDDKYVLAFRGSVSPNDWVSDFKFWKKSWPYSNDCMFKGVKIHHGFIDDYNTVRNKVIREIGDIITSLNSSGKKLTLTICGHSLGGALASIAVLDLASIYGDYINLSCYTSGSPRVFNTEGSLCFSKIVDYAYRVTYAHDIVPNVPIWGYTHVGRLFHVLHDLSIDHKDYYIIPIFASVTEHLIDVYTNVLQSIYLTKDLDSVLNNDISS